jgi:hypothetical protein|tara:strand:+ start:1378 stop:1917 length:540 start_codon:yes stop_codon:yes gene_type:complete
VKYIIPLVMVLMIPTLLYGADSNTVSSSTVTGTTTVDRTPSTAVSPNIVINNQDICKTGISGAAQSAWFGISMGKTIEDKNCQRLKLARSLYGMGMKVASVSLLCQDTRVFQAMEMAGTPCPIDGKIGEAAKVIWDKEPYRRPDYYEWRERRENKDKVAKLDTFTSNEQDAGNWDDEGY